MEKICLYDDVLIALYDDFERKNILLVLLLEKKKQPLLIKVSILNVLCQITTKMSIQRLAFAGNFQACT